MIPHAYDLWEPVARTLQTIATVTFPVIAARGWKTLSRIDQKAGAELLQRLASQFVRAVEQQFADGMDNETKRRTVIEQLHQRLPWFPEWMLEAAVEAAVMELKHQKTVAQAYATIPEKGGP